MTSKPFKVETAVALNAQEQSILSLCKAVSDGPDVRNGNNLGTLFIWWIETMTADAAVKKLFFSSSFCPQLAGRGLSIVEQDTGTDDLVQVGFIQPNPFGEVRFVVIVFGLNVSGGNIADGLLIATKLHRKLLEGIHKALSAYVGNAPKRHSSLCVNALQRLGKEAIALAASVSLDFGKDACWFPDWGIEESHFTLTMLVKSGIHNPTGLAHIGRFGVDGMDNHALVVFVNAGWLPARQSQDVGHSAESYKANPAVTVLKEDAVSLVQVSLVKGYAVMVKKGVGVSKPDFTVKLNGLLPVIWLVVSDVSPFLRSMVWAVPAGRTRGFRPPHTAHQINAFTPVHALLDEHIPIGPAAGGLGNALHLIGANSNPEVSRLNPLRHSPAMGYALLPLIGAITGKLSILAALVCKDRHQDGFPFFATPHINLGKKALRDTIKGDANSLQCWGDDRIHVLPGSGLLSLCVHYDSEIRRRNPSRNDKSCYRSRLHPATRRPYLSSFHVPLSTS